MLPRESCAQCGFDSDLYDRPDTISSQQVIPLLLRSAIEGLAPEVLRQRPDPQTWSIGEYLDHVREVAFGNRFVIESGLADPGIDLGEPPENELSDMPAEIDTDAALEAMTVEYGSLGSLLARLDAHEWNTLVTVEGKTKSIEWFARHVLHDGLHHLADIGRIRHTFGLGASTHTGQVSQLSVSNGGVPKLAVETATIGPSGVDGDAQNDRRHHGRPVQAVCLWSADVIETLRLEGHPIAAGNAGENVTVAGIDWATVRPGTRIAVGDVPMLVSAYAIPCAKNAQWFVDRDFKRMLHDRHPGFSRIYAIPLNTGQVSVGDLITIEPPQA